MDPDPRDTGLFSILKTMLKIFFRSVDTLNDEFLFTIFHLLSLIYPILPWIRIRNTDPDPQNYSNKDCSFGAVSGKMILILRFRNLHTSDVDPDPHWIRIQELWTGSNIFLY